MDFLTIGNITKDIVPGGYTVGGTVTYASVAALRLGRQPGVLTRMDADLMLPEVYREIELIALPSAHTLTFENIYTPDGRVQVIHALGDPIQVEDVPPSLRLDNPEIVLLGPLAQELDYRVAELFPNSLLGMVPQGWMRHWDDQGRVHHNPIDCADNVLRCAQVLVLSIEDIAHDLDLAQCYSQVVPLMVLTRGAHGCDVYYDGHETHVRPRRAVEIDPTGAGDTFAATFLVYYAETGDPLRSARYANIAASFAVEGSGTSALPTRAQIEAYIDEHGW